MPKVSAAFFGWGTLCVFLGMMWGMHMGSSEDFTMMPAHAHLNLLGWVTMALYGTFYALTAGTTSPKLAWTNFWVSAAGVVLMIPSLAMYLQDQSDKTMVPVLIAGEVLTFAGLLIFGWSVFKELTRAR
jgi:cbb3-type cytochrome oxidase subunit 1